MFSRDSKLSAALVPMLTSPCLVDELLDAICQWVIATSGSKHAKIFLVDREREELCCRASSTPTNLALRIPIGSGLHGRAFADGAARTATSADDSPILILPLFTPGMAEQQQSAIGMLEVVASHRQTFSANNERMRDVAASVARVLACARMDDSRYAPAHITDVVGTSDVMQSLYSQIEDASRTCMPVVLRGCHGTGKTLLAGAIHTLSSRRQAKCVAVQCHLDRVFLELELFGVPGSMQGLLEQAAGGTLLVEQMDLLSVAVQHELLAKARLTDTRIIATLLPNRNLPAGLDRHQSISVPTLEERGRRDTAMLIRFFTRNWAAKAQQPTLSITPAMVARLCKQAWPGNVRQLEDSVQHALLSDPRETGDSVPQLDKAERWIPSGLRLADAEERYILRTLAENNENRTRTANALGIGRNTLVRKIKQYRDKAIPE